MIRGMREDIRGTEQTLTTLLWRMRPMKALFSPCWGLVCSLSPSTYYSIENVSHLDFTCGSEQALRKSGSRTNREFMGTAETNEALNKHSTHSPF